MDLTNIQAEDCEYLADQLLNRYLLSIYNPEKQTWRNYQFYEVEFYLHCAEHPDPYVHRDKQQLRNGEWYFHKAKANGENYKGGTFKGLDLVFGSSEEQKNRKYGGILIRSIFNLEVVEGPCKTVDHILSKTGSAHISELVKKMKSLSVFDNNYLKIIPNPEPTTHFVYASRRVGLKEEKSPKYAKAEYRFIINPHKIKKDRANIKRGMKEHHYMTDEEIKEIITHK